MCPNSKDACPYPISLRSVPAALHRHPLAQLRQRHSPLQHFPRILPMLPRIPVSFRSAATSAMHPADLMSLYGGCPARLPGPLRSRMTSRAGVHR